MKKNAIMCSLLALSGFSALSCGPAEVGGHVQMELRLAAFSSSDILTVYALSQDLKGGGKLSCAQLKDETFGLDDGKLEILGQDSTKGVGLESGPVTLVLDELPAGSNRIFVAEVLDPNNRVGFGCTPNITITAGQKTTVELTVNEI